MTRRYSIGVAGAFIGLGLLISGCGEDNPIRWKEDVLLSNGQVITLDRYQEFRGAHALGERPGPSNYWFDLVDPKTKDKVRFNGTSRSSTEALLISDGTLYLLIGLQGGAWDSPELNCPDPGFLLWSVKGGAWQQVPFDEIPQRVIKANMSLDGYAAGENDQLKKYAGHLPIEITQDQIAQFPNRPRVYDFSKMERQTTGQENCNLGRGMYHAPYFKR